MPTADEHIKKAARNENFAEFLATKTKYIDWAVTMLFYAALHYVDAVLAASSIHPSKHAERKDAIERNDTVKRVYSEYRALETTSVNARYYAMPIDESDWHAVKPQFDTLRSHLRNRLGIKD